MKLKIHKPVDKSQKINDRIDLEKLYIDASSNKDKEIDDFNFEEELIDFLKYDFKGFPSQITANINGLGLGFILGIIFSLLLALVFKVKL